MAVNIISVQCNSRFLPDIILLTLCCYHRGTRLNAMKRFLSFRPITPLKDIFFP